MNDDKDKLIKGLLKLLDDTTIEQLQSLAYWEWSERTEVKVKRGDFPPLTPEENAHLSVSRVETIRRYRDRTGLNLHIARRVVDVVVQTEAEAYVKAEHLRINQAP